MNIEIRKEEIITALNFYLAKKRKTTFFVDFCEDIENSDEDVFTIIDKYKENISDIINFFECSYAKYNNINFMHIVYRLSNKYNVTNEDIYSIEHLKQYIELQLYLNKRDVRQDYNIIVLMFLLYHTIDKKDLIDISVEDFNFNKKTLGVNGKTYILDDVLCNYINKNKGDIYVEVEKNDTVNVLCYQNPKLDNGKTSIFKTINGRKLEDKTLNYWFYQSIVDVFSLHLVELVKMGRFMCAYKLEQKERPNSFLMDLDEVSVIVKEYASGFVAGSSVNRFKTEYKLWRNRRYYYLITNNYNKKTKGIDWLRDNKDRYKL